MLSSCKQPVNGPQFTAPVNANPETLAMLARYNKLGRAQRIRLIEAYCAYEGGIHRRTFDNYLKHGNAGLLYWMDNYLRERHGI